MEQYVQIRICNCYISLLWLFRVEHELAKIDNSVRERNSVFRITSVSNCGGLMLSLTCAWINGRVSDRETGYFRRHRAQYDVTVMEKMSPAIFSKIAGTSLCVLHAVYAKSLTVSIYISDMRLLKKSQSTYMVCQTFSRVCFWCGDGIYYSTTTFYLFIIVLQIRKERNGAILWGLFRFLPTLSLRVKRHIGHTKVFSCRFACQQSKIPIWKNNKSWLSFFQFSTWRIKSETGFYRSYLHFSIIVLGYGKKETRQ